MVDNARDYASRRWDTCGPLAGRQGPQGRAIAVRTAARAALTAGVNMAEAVCAARYAGIPAVQPRLW